MKHASHFNKVKLVYYTGTGGTEKVTNLFRENLINRAKQVEVEKISSRNTIVPNSNWNPDLLILLFPVHSFNAPEGVYEWIKTSKNQDDISTIVISVSGGGEISPNTACRARVIKMLENKNYNVFYERMIVMPSNFIFPSKYPLSKMLLDVLPFKIQNILDEIESGVIRRTKPYFIDKIFSRIGELEKTSAKDFGKHINVSGDCNLCGKCYENCPSNNIDLIDNKLRFGSKCHLCLACIYACPKKALMPSKLKFIIIKEGYNIKEMEKLDSVEITEKNVKKVAKGYIWKGVRDYLLGKD